MLQSQARFEAAGRHLDVIAVNYYHAWSPDPVRVANWVKWSGKPFLVTEWYAKGMDAGFANSNFDSNKGIVNLRLEPYSPLLQAMHELNRQVCSLADYFDRRAR